MALLAATALTVVAQIRDLQPEGGLAMPGQQDNRTVMNRDTTKTDKRVDVNGVKGLYLESTINGARLFFSCSGNGNGRSWNNRASNGNYWSSTWNSARNARNLNFNSGGVNPQNNNNRYNGRALRPVQ